MSKFTLRRFADGDWLRSISANRLLAFLAPWARYLEKRGFAAPGAPDAEPDYAALSRALMSPGPETPADMVDAFYYIHETSALEDVEVLQEELQMMGIHIPWDPRATLADYVIDVWLADPNVIRTYHAQLVARAQKTFDYYAARHYGRRKFPEISAETRIAIESAFDTWFDANRRGQGCRLLTFRQPGVQWMAVRHGRSMRREASHKDDGSAGTEFYRPQLHDVLFYDERTGEIAVHAETKKAAQLYLRTLGTFLFDDPDYFPQAAKYTLAPLIEDGRAALLCEDIPGLEHVTLVEYRTAWGGPYKETETRRASDIFAAFGLRGLDGIRGRAPVMAAFKVRFENSPRERRVVIRIPASAQYERSDDCEIIETWLQARGFLLPRDPETDDEAFAEVLAGS